MFLGIYLSDCTKLISNKFNDPWDPSLWKIKTHETFCRWACRQSQKLWDLDNNQNNQMKLLTICWPIKNLLFFNAIASRLRSLLLNPFVWKLCHLPRPDCTSLIESFGFKKWTHSIPPSFFSHVPPIKIMLTLLRWVIHSYPVFHGRVAGAGLFFANGILCGAEWGHFESEINER